MREAMCVIIANGDVLMVAVLRATVPVTTPAARHPSAAPDLAASVRCVETTAPRCLKGWTGLTAHLRGARNAGQNNDGMPQRPAR